MICYPQFGDRREKRVLLYSAVNHRRKLEVNITVDDDRITDVPSSCSGLTPIEDVSDVEAVSDDDVELAVVKEAVSEPSSPSASARRSSMESELREMPSASEPRDSRSADIS